MPSPAKVPPSEPGWIHEIKRDGFRILARRDSAGVRLITRAGNDFSSRFPFIAMAVNKLPVSSCLIDGEAIVCDENGLAVFELIRGHSSKASAALCAFDLLELDGKDLRRQPIEIRKDLLAKLLKGSHLSIVINEHFEEDGASVYRQPRIRFHDLRHTHPTLLLASGVHPKIASERLGHSKVGITLDLYSHVLPDMQADAAALVDNAFRVALNKPETKR